MSMAVVAVVGGVAAVGAAGIGAYSSNKAGKDAKSAAATAAGQYTATGKKADSMLKKYQRLLSDPSRVLALTNNVNNENRPEAEAQARRINNFNTVELHKQINRSLPGYQGMIGLAMRNTRSWLRGQLPSDVAAAVEDRAAEKASRFGLPADSVNRKALTARDLGRTSLDLMEKGENSLQRWISTARSFLTPTLASPMDFLFTPTQFTNTALAGADIATRRGNILLGAGNAATGAYLQGAEAGIKADLASAQAISQGLESLGGIGMSYASYKGGGAGAGGARAGGGAGDMSGMLAALGMGGAGGVSTARPNTSQSYLNL
jgi:hypothetical protein